MFSRSQKITSDIQLPKSGAESPNLSGLSSSGKQADSPLVMAGIVLVGAFVLAAGAAGLVTYWQQSGESVQLLSGLKEARSKARLLYSSKNGYGPAGTPMNPWTEGALPQGWSGTGAGARHNQGGTVEMQSTVTSFSVRLTDLSPIACWQVLSRLDSGWQQASYSGKPISVPANSAEMRSACGFLRSGTLELTSAG